MATSESTWVDVGLTVVAAFAMFFGAAIFAYGLLFVPTSVLGGLHVAAIGASLFLAGLFATTWAGARFDLDPVERRRLSLAFAVLALLLGLAFLVLSYATFTEFSVESGETAVGVLQA